MHELSVTEGLLKICLDEGQKHKIKKINEINIVVGELTDLIPECISYYFNIVAMGTIAENAKINIEYVPVNIICRSCGYEGPLGQEKYLCPKCSGADYKITKGKEFYLNTMEVD